MTAADKHGSVPLPRGRAGWPTAYKPLRPLSLAAQIVGLVGFELLLYQAYAVHDSRFHYATHLLVALIAAAAVNALFLLTAARPAPAQLLGVAGWHLVAMWPDLVFRLGIPHYRWMDPLALFHISSHYMPGADTTWLLLAGAASALYTGLLWAWLRARAAEAGQGLAPGLGIGGSAVWRAQLDPVSTPLAAVDEGTAEEVSLRRVLVHGLGATKAVWQPVAGRLAAAGAPSTRLDLLGYGQSLRIGTRFTVEEQAGALRAAVRQLPRVHLVGHSWGCVVVAEAVQDHPDLVEKITLVSPAVFADARLAQERFAERSWLARRTVAGAGVSSAVCGAMCLLRPLLVPLAGRLRGDLPAAVARGGVQHHYPAFRDGLRSLWEDNPLPGLLADPPVPLAVVLADQDLTVRPDDVLSLPRHPSVRVHRVAGTHLLPLEHPEVVAAVLLEQPECGTQPTGSPQNRTT